MSNNPLRASLKSWLPPLAVACGATLFLWWHSSPHPAKSSKAQPPKALQASARSPGKSASQVATEKAVENALQTPGDGAVVASSAPAAPSPSAAVTPLTAELAGVAPDTVLQNMRITIRQYGAMFGGNPVGTNPEITRALNGENPRHINFLKEDGNRVNSQGELVDVWGTPYFFHQLSGTEMEIRSAGPDRIMYTADDLVIK